MIRAETCGFPTVDRKLAGMYAERADHYKSYPAASYFLGDFTEASFRLAASQSNGDPIPRPLAFDVNIPSLIDSRRWDQDGVNRYLTRLIQEISMMSDLLDNDRRVVSVNLNHILFQILSISQLYGLMEELSHHFRFNVSRSMQLSSGIDASVCDKNALDLMAALHFNKIYVICNDDESSFVGSDSVAHLSKLRSILAASKDAGFDTSVSIDLGIIIDDFKSVAQNVVALRGLLETRPVGVLFRYPCRVKDGDRAVDGVFSLADAALHLLADAGYIHVGMDQFAMEGSELSSARRDHRLHYGLGGYATYDDSDYVGLGVGSISSVRENYSCNMSDASSYFAALDSGHLPVCGGVVMSHDDIVRRSIIHEFICYGCVRFEDIEGQYGICFRSHFLSELDRLERYARLGIVDVDQTHFSVTDRGRLLMPVIARCFDSYRSHRQGAVQLVQ